MVNQVKKNLTNIFKNIIWHLFAGESPQVVKITLTYSTWMILFQICVCPDGPDSRDGRYFPFPLSVPGTGIIFMEREFVGFFLFLFRRTCS
jgi:hypothetical protein